VKSTAQRWENTFLDHVGSGGLWRAFQHSGHRLGWLNIHIYQEGWNMAETIQERINRYLEDTIGAERNFEKALSTFGKAGDQNPVQRLLSSASAKAKTQHERLEALLKSRGGSPSEGKTILAEMLAFTPLSAQVGQVRQRRTRSISW
jgi:hypothetical protein